MLIQIWERFHGYDRWKPATATVKSSSVANSGFGWKSIATIVWNDQNGGERTAIFDAFEESRLYQLVDGDRVDIRFNPDNPAEFYLPGLLDSKLAQAWKAGIFTVLIILALAAEFGPILLGAFFQ